MIIVKWGGVLTQAGRKQAISLGEGFRRQVYGGMVVRMVMMIVMVKQ